MNKFVLSLTHGRVKIFLAAVNRSSGCFLNAFSFGLIKEEVLGINLKLIFFVLLLRIWMGNKIKEVEILKYVS